MSELMKILLVEDNEGEIQSYKEALETHIEANGYEIDDLVVCKNIEEASSKIDNSLDAAIIDLRLGDDADGNDVIKLIENRLHRLPIAIYSGTPQDAEDQLLTPLIEKYTKADKSFTEIIDDLYVFFKTGITKIFGGRGVLEESMDQVLHNSVIPQINTWKKYAQEKNIEKSLIRLTINQLNHLLDDEDDNCLREEMYISPAFNDLIYTGSILKKGNSFYIVVSPPCDLVVRGQNGINTSKIAICEIEDHDDIVKKRLGNSQPNSNGGKKIIVKNISNKQNIYHHWLPKTEFFSGGFVNFRHVYSLTKQEIEDNYTLQPNIVAPSFMKDIISRFSSYYARQGQPDFNFDEIAGELGNSIAD